MVEFTVYYGSYTTREFESQVSMVIINTELCSGLPRLNNDRFLVYK